MNELMMCMMMAMFPCESGFANVLLKRNPCEYFQQNGACVVTTTGRFPNENSLRPTPEGIRIRKSNS